MNETGQAVREMPRYKCHKEVWALKLAGVGPSDPSGSAELFPEEDGYGPIAVPFSYMSKHNPVVGGYYVVYPDGYKSFSPAKAFEEGYTLISQEHP